MLATHLDDQWSTVETISPDDLAKCATSRDIRVGPNSMPAVAVTELTTTDQVVGSASLIMDSADFRLVIGQ